MTHGIGEVVSEHGDAMKTVQNNSHNHSQSRSNSHTMQQAASQRKNVGVMGSRRIFAAPFKLKVLDSYRNDIDCRGNQRATARKYGIHRRQIQKWLQCEENLRSSCSDSNATTTVTSSGCCAVPIGNNNGSAPGSPGSLISGQSEGNAKGDLTATTCTSSSSVSSSSSLVNSKSNSPMNNITKSIGSPGALVSTPAAVGTAAPALNLSLARPHGDEEQHRRAASPQNSPVPPRAPMHHSNRRASSPLQYYQHSISSENNHQQVPSSSSRVPLRGMHVGYEIKSQQNSLQNQQHSHQERHHRRQELADDHHEMSERLAQDSSLRTSDRKYAYDINRPNYEPPDARNGAFYRLTNVTDGYYQGLESYHKHTGFFPLRNNNLVNNNNNNNNNAKDQQCMRFIDGPISSYQDKNEAGNEERSLQLAQTTSFASSPSSSPPIAPPSSLLVLHPTTIKSERASPDSLATPGPCENPGSPESAASEPRARRNRSETPQRQHRIASQLVTRVGTVHSSDTQYNSVHVCGTTNTSNSNGIRNVTTGVANATTGLAAIATAVHSNEAAAASLAHVHVRVDSHAFEPRISENRLRERAHQHQCRDGVKVEYEERARIVKEEVSERDEYGSTGIVANSGVAAAAAANSSPVAGGAIMGMMTMLAPKREDSSEEDALSDDSRYRRELSRTDTIGSCPDYRVPTRIPTSLSSGDRSATLSPSIKESTGTFSDPSSPRAASSSGISTSSSCSDSEIDPLDYSPTSSTRNVTSDLSRRRSFSLRFKLDVLDAFHRDVTVAGNQRATARKFGINRRQVQKWLGQESELRGEIALRGGDLRQRLGPVLEISTESSTAVDLRTCSMSGLPACGLRNDVDLEHSSPPLYCCDIGSSSQKYGYYHRREGLTESPDAFSRNCTLSCCVENFTNNSMCYQEPARLRRSSSGYPESQGSLYCYSPKDSLENDVISDVATSTSLKRSACTLSCCYEMPPSPKRICLEAAEAPSHMFHDPLPQDVPLCLVKPKMPLETPTTNQREPVTSTVPTPPANQSLPPPAVNNSTNKDAILFKPYLDNPISKPTDDTHLSTHYNANHRDLSPSSVQSVIVNNNNNCHDICNLNEERTIIAQHDYALELSLRLPGSWHAQQTGHRGYSEFPERMRSAFVRYPASPHYT